MRKKVLLSLVLVGFVFTTGFIKSDSDIYFRIAKSIDLFGRVYKEVATGYVDKINPEEFMLAGIKGMLSSLDPYSGYIGEDEQGDMDLITKGKYGGIGASVGLRNDDIVIVDLLEGYSAQRQGMQVGDIILKVNDVKVSRDNYYDLGSLLKGEPGSFVTIAVKREGNSEELVFNLVLEEIEVKNITYYGFVPESSNTAYIKLSGFSRSAGEEVKDALLDMRAKKQIDGIVLDLRGNPGGLLAAAIDVSEKFLPKEKLVVSVMGRDTTKMRHYFSKEEPIAGKTKLIVLIDGHSASASEIVAGAIQDHDRGVILGTHSFGKGLVQTVIPLSFNTSLKLTTARYFTPSGRCIQRINYSERSKVFDDVTRIEKSAYKTDSGREVFAAGGIKPDTVVTSDSDSPLIEQLLAQGMFFDFATNYFNRSKNGADDLSDQQLFDKFDGYLNEKEFEFSFKSEKLLKQLVELAESNNYGTRYKDELEKVRGDFQTIKEKELDKYKKEIVTEIKLELKSRTDGRVGRIIESLNYDKQYSAALNVLSDDCIYSRFLGSVCE